MLFDWMVDGEISHEARGASPQTPVASSVTDAQDLKVSLPSPTAVSTTQCPSRLGASAVCSQKEDATTIFRSEPRQEAFFRSAHGWTRTPPAD